MEEEREEAGQIKSGQTGAGSKAAGQIEVINFPDLHIPIQRQPTTETYLALQPPDALPYVVAPFTSPIEDIVAFVQLRLDALRELQTEMLKHYSKTKSTKCHFKTGDVAYLLGRPFMLRCNPLSTTKNVKKPTRSTASLQATMRSEYSVIELYVAQAGNYDQGRAAFMSFAQRVFTNNIKSLLKQCMDRVFPEVTVPAKVNSRPMRNPWVRIDEERDVVWFSESLIPYPVNAVVYAFLVEAIKYYAPEASEEERQELLEKGVPNWSAMKSLLADPDNRYAL